MDKIEELSEPIFEMISCRCMLGKLAECIFEHGGDEVMGHMMRAVAEFLRNWEDSLSGELDGLVQERNEQKGGGE
jgi:hypothetical protein